MPRRTGSMRTQLHDIMMAQDFQDRTGQVIGRIGSLMHTLEGSLLAILVESRPDGAREDAGGLAGPSVRASADTAANQGEVDDLLDSLGF
jgi:chemotaxis protein CheZ